MNKAKTIYEVEEIKDVIDFMKSEKTITDISESNGISTITSSTLLLLHSYTDTYLKVGQIVTLNKINYPVLSVDLSLKQFTIEATGLYHMSTDINPVKVLDVTKWNLAVNFMRGSQMEIKQRLKIESEDPNQNLTRFPLIWMFINNKQTKNVTPIIDIKTRIDFAFVNLTKVHYTTDERDTYNFRPVLDPLIELFIDAILSPYFSKVFYFKDRKNYEYDKWYRYFYGSSDKNINQQVLNAPTDAIESSFEMNFLKQFS